MTTPSTPQRPRLAVLASGSGTTLQNLIDRSADGSLSADVILVISEHENSGALERARKANIPAESVPWKKDPQGFADRAFEHIRHHHADLVVLAGFMKLLIIPPDFTGHVINVHPALIPAFSGKGYFGHHVHEAVLNVGAKVTGCTVHFCDNEYDHGPIILQRVVTVNETDTPMSLAERVQAAEREALPEAINLISQNRLTIVDHRVHIQ